jgi:hypothetical protein
LDGSQASLGFVLAAVGLSCQFLIIPAMNNVIEARKKFNIGHPYHHLAPGENNITEENRCEPLSFLF